MKLSLVCDGTPKGTKVVAGPEREPIELLQSYALTESMEQPGVQFLTLTVMVQGEEWPYRKPKPDSGPEEKSVE